MIKITLLKPFHYSSSFIPHITIFIFFVVFMLLNINITYAHATQGSNNTTEIIAESNLRVPSNFSIATNQNNQLGESQGKAVTVSIDDIDPSLWEGGIVPFSDAPLCENHNDTEFHTLWNKEKGCHYDHTHGYDPSKTVFKDIVSKWDQEISYPWQTPNENMNKHKGYIYLYTEAESGCELGRFAQQNAQGCIRKILVQVHSLGTVMEAVTRFHSYRFVAEVCSLDQTQCGFVEGGGQTDYGVTHCPYKQGSCPKSSDPLPLFDDNGVLPEFVKLSQPPYVATPTIFDMERLLRSGRITQFWNGSKPNKIVSGYYPNNPNSLLGLVWSSVDAWSLIDPSDASSGMYTEHFICLEGNCTYNHSEFRVYSLTLSLPEKSAETAVFYTDTNGNVSTECTSSSSSCVPLLVSDSVPKEVKKFYLDRQVHPDNAPELEFDICFDSETDMPQGCNKSSSKTSGWLKPKLMMM